MNTTSVIAEVLVSGFLALIWIFLFVFGLSNDDFKFVSELAVKYENWTGILLFATVAISYQLGWMIIHLSYLPVHKVLLERLRKRIFTTSRNPIFTDDSYRDFKIYAYKNSSDEYVASIEKDRGIIRLSRAGLINFFALAGTMILYKSYVFSAVFLFVFIGCCMQVYVAYNSMYSKIEKSLDGYNFQHHLKSR